MAAGGIHDQLGGGFARYSVDAGWIVPHFEKMLYDNALLARTYLRAHLELGHERYRSVAVAICEWALREMLAPEGGFYSALDADSEGVEGRFYTWTPAEARAALGDAGLEHLEPELLTHFGIGERGPLEGRSVLHLPLGLTAPAPAGLEAGAAALFAAREKRVRPGLDDKRICSWNALMAGSLAEIGAAIGEPRYVDAARRCMEFVLGEMRDADGRLLRAYNDGRAHLNAYLEDHAYLLEALLTLYESTFEARWFEAAREIAATMVARFADEENGGFFTTSDDHEELIVRRKDLDDHPTPSGNSAAARGLLRLAALTGEAAWAERARGVLLLLAEPARRHPQGLAYLLSAVDLYVSPTREVALVAPAGDRTALAPLAAAVRSRYRPHAVLAGGTEGERVPELLADRPADSDALAYVCEGFACKAPVDDDGRARGAARLEAPAGLSGGGAGASPSSAASRPCRATRAGRSRTRAGRRSGAGGGARPRRSAPARRRRSRRYGPSRSAAGSGRGCPRRSCRAERSPSRRGASVATGSGCTRRPVTSSRAGAGSAAGAAPAAARRREGEQSKPRLRPGESSDQRRPGEAGRAGDDGGGVDAEPLLEQRAVDGAEVGCRAQVVVLVE